MAAPKGHPPYPGSEKGGPLGALSPDTGRPKKYTDEFIQIQAENLLKWLKEDESRFWIKDFCLDQMLPPRLMSEWKEIHKGFSESFELARSIQESRLYKAGLLETFNAGLVKFGLINNHKENWAEKTEVTHKGDSENPLAMILQNAKSKCDSQGLVDMEIMD